MKLVRAILAASFVAGIGMAPAAAVAQNTGWDESRQRIEAVEVRIANPPAEAREADLLVDEIRRTLSVYPTAGFDRFFIEAGIGKVRRLPRIATADYELSQGVSGVVVTVTATVQPAAEKPLLATGLLAGTSASFPELYRRGDTLLKLGVSGAVNFNFNDRAWYSQPTPLLQGNPLVYGPPGPGSFSERSAFLEVGLYGITPVTDNLYAYAGGSYLGSGSSGQDLFDRRDRLYGGWEDRYAGLIGGFSTGRGDRVVFNLSGGRKKFSVGDGFVIGATSANGDDRAMINFSPRWAADNLWLAEVRWNVAKVQVFHIDPDELPSLESRTRVQGVNLEVDLTPRLKAAAMHVRVPQSDTGYFLPDFSKRTREGLRVWDARMEWRPSPGQPGPFVLGELAVQTNANFPMRAVGGWTQLGWSFADKRYAPRVSYRYALLPGDDPRTARYERWDPLLMGISPWDWVQGMNHGKVFGNANRISHRLQVETRVRPSVQLIAQYWEFRADEYNNIGGLGVLTTLGSRNLGREANVMGRWFFSRNAFFQAQMALTQPGPALEQAVAGTRRPWLFFNTFVRMSF